MTGSVFDGEDIVQTAIEKAYYALGQMTDPPQLRPWLFSIARQAAYDAERRGQVPDAARTRLNMAPMALDDDLCKSPRRNDSRE